MNFLGVRTGACFFLGGAYQDSGLNLYLALMPRVDWLLMIAWGYQLICCTSIVYRQNTAPVGTVYVFPHHTEIALCLAQSPLPSSMFIWYFSPTPP